MSCCGTNPGYEELDEVSRLVAAKLAAFLKTLRDNAFAVGLREGQDAADSDDQGNRRSEQRAAPRRCAVPSYFWAISFRYQARMVSGLATQPTSRSALRPKRFPISASVRWGGTVNS